MRQRFEQEARIAARLIHPYIVAVLDYGEDHDACYLVMERLPGTTLRDEMSRGPIPMRRAVLVMMETLTALEAAHRYGVLHRDIKPSNILHQDDGHTKIADFGIAKSFDLRALMHSVPGRRDTDGHGAGDAWVPRSGTTRRRAGVGALGPLRRGRRHGGGLDGHTAGAGGRQRRAGPTAAPGGGGQGGRTGPRGPLHVGRTDASGVGDTATRPPTGAARADVERTAAPGPGRHPAHDRHLVAVARRRRSPHHGAARRSAARAHTPAAQAPAPIGRISHRRPCLGRRARGRGRARVLGEPGTDTHCRTPSDADDRAHQQRAHTCHYGIPGPRARATSSRSGHALGRHAAGGRAHGASAQRRRGATRRCVARRRGPGGVGARPSPARQSRDHEHRLPERGVRAPGHWRLAGRCAAHPHAVVGPGRDWVDGVDRRDWVDGVDRRDWVDGVDRRDWVDRAGSRAGAARTRRRRRNRPPGLSGPTRNRALALTLRELPIMPG